MRSIVVSLMIFTSAVNGAAEDECPRLMVLTDIGGDPDDQQSLIRLMLYSNEFELEGLIATASGTPGELKEAVTRTDLVRQIVDAYGEVRDNLAQHAEGYPTAEDLRARIKSGNKLRGREAIGKGHNTEGSDWIIRCADRDDPRPLNITIWGGQTDLAQALWYVRETRGEGGLKKFIDRIRVYDINDQDRIQPWIFENFPDLWYVLASAPHTRDKREGAYRGMYLDGDISLTSREWLDEHLLKGHGPLTALYPTRTWTAPNPHSALKEGDTPSWFYFLPHGVNDPAHPDWGGWGGRFQKADRGLWRDAVDKLGDQQSARNTVQRWRPIFQNDFQARSDWCVKLKSEANHPPNALLAGESKTPAKGGVSHRTAAAGATLKLDAAASTDSDGDQLRFRWWQYVEPGTYQHEVPIDGAKKPNATVNIPADASGKTIHLVLEVTDDGVPPLTSLRRVVLEVK